MTSQRVFSLLLYFILSLSVSSAWAKEYLVKYKEGRLLSMLSQYGFTVKDHHEPGQIVKVKITDDMAAPVIAELYRSGDIEYIVPNGKLYAFNQQAKQQDFSELANSLKEQWHIAKIKAEAAWKKAGNKGNKKIIVAVIDTGVDYKHEALSPNMITGYDFRQNDEDPMDKTSPQNPGHGTHCAGIVGATGLVDGGVIGASPEVSIMPIRFLGEDGSGDFNNAIKAVDYAVQKGAHIISASWGATVNKAQVMPLIEAIERAQKAGVIFIAAAANDGKNNDKTSVYPANVGGEHFISVAASGPSDEKPQWSNYGRSTVHLASPGLNIMSTLPGNKYNNLSGTSMATPLVSGLVAFLKAQDESLTGKEIKAILQQTGAPVNIATECQCRIDAEKATEVVVDKKMFVTPATATLDPGASLALVVKNASGKVSFKSSDDSVLSVSESGQLTAGKEGEARITITDGSNQSITTPLFLVGKAKGGGGGDDGGGGQPPEMGECPLDDPMLCQIICQIMPEAPWCK